MKNPLRQVLIVLILAFAVGTSGCATTKEVDALKADVKTAMDRAAAERAEKAAMDAKAAAEATDEKIDRMFKKTMNK